MQCAVADSHAGHWYSRSVTRHVDNKSHQRDKETAVCAEVLPHFICVFLICALYVTFWVTQMS